MSLTFGFLFVTLLILANAYCVALEFALVAADRQKLEAAAETGGLSSRTGLSLSRRLSFHLSGAQLGITISSLLLGKRAGSVMGRLLDPVIGPIFGGGAATLSLILALLIATVLQMVVGELIPNLLRCSK